MIWLYSFATSAVKKRKGGLIGLVLALLFFSACSSEEAFLELEKETLTTNAEGKATLNGETNEGSTVTIDGKKISLSDGKFSQVITLSDLEDKEVTVVTEFNDEKIEKDVLIQVSDSFTESLERANAESVLKLAEKETTQDNYDKAFTLISSLSKEYEDIDERLDIVKEHIPIHEAVALAEKEQTKEKLDSAKDLVANASLNKEKLNGRLTKVEKKITEKEEEQKTLKAKEAIEKAEKSLSEEDYNSAVSLIEKISDGNSDFSSRISKVKQSIDEKKEEERVAQEKAAAEAASQAQAVADAAAAQAEANAQQENNQQIVLVTPTGKKYHSRKCGNGTYTEATLQEALNRGLTPCAKCFPG